MAARRLRRCRCCATVVPPGSSHASRHSTTRSTHGSIGSGARRSTRCSTGSPRQPTTASCGSRSGACVPRGRVIPRWPFASACRWAWSRGSRTVPSRCASVAPAGARPAPRRAAPLRDAPPDHELVPVRSCGVGIHRRDAVEQLTAAPAYFVLAGLVASSRVYVKMHHASDVLVGAALGIALGAIARRVLPLE